MARCCWLCAQKKEDHDTPKSVTSVGRAPLAKARGVIRQRSRSACTLIGALSVPTITKLSRFAKAARCNCGLGGTYTFGARLWAGIGSDDELGCESLRARVFRVASAQVLRDHAYPTGTSWLTPTGSLPIRRWQVVEKGPVKGFVWVWASAKDGVGSMSATRWISQNSSGCAFGFPERSPWRVDRAALSNAGIRLPNHGQDFVTLTIRLNSGRFGIR